MRRDRRQVVRAAHLIVLSVEPNYSQVSQMATHPTAEMVDARSLLLAAPARSSEIPESADAYGWLVGSWELDVLRPVYIPRTVESRHA